MTSFVPLFSEFCLNRLKKLVDPFRKRKSKPKCMQRMAKIYRLSKDLYLDF